MHVLVIAAGVRAGRVHDPSGLSVRHLSLHQPPYQAEGQSIQSGCTMIPSRG